MTKLFWREIAGAAIKLTNQVTLLNSKGKENGLWFRWSTGSNRFQRMHFCSFFPQLSHGNLRIFFPVIWIFSGESAIVFPTVFLNFSKNQKLNHFPIGLQTCYKRFTGLILLVLILAKSIHNIIAGFRSVGFRINRGLTQQDGCKTTGRPPYVFVVYENL